MEHSGISFTLPLIVAILALFVPIFFIMVGVDFGLPALFASRSAALLVPLMVGIAYLVKSIPALWTRIERGGK